MDTTEASDLEREKRHDTCQSLPCRSRSPRIGIDPFDNAEDNDTDTDEDDGEDLDGSDCPGDM
eukprot:841050-Pyramimonas_sp.AAC.1